MPVMWYTNNIVRTIINDWSVHTVTMFFLAVQHIMKWGQNRFQVVICVFQVPTRYQSSRKSRIIKPYIGVFTRTLTPAFRWFESSWPNQPKDRKERWFFAVFWHWRLIRPLRRLLVFSSAKAARLFQGAPWRAAPPCKHNRQKIFVSKALHSRKQLLYWNQFLYHTKNCYGCYDKVLAP